MEIRILQEWLYLADMDIDSAKLLSNRLRFATTLSSRIEPE
jgi:hypothetical protein